MPSYDDARFSPPAPIANVTIRNPTTAKTESHVAMLIDSGADVTLLPAAVVSALGLERATATYTLMAFDGQLREAAAVRAELMFLGRTFKGQFLLTEQATGILGRDVLNHVSVVLDGPDRSWTEQQSKGA